MGANADLKELQKATREYVANERRRLLNEASVLKAILRGRLGSQKLSKLNTERVAAVAKKDLTDYLR